MNDMDKAQLNAVLNCPRVLEISTHGWCSREELKKQGMKQNVRQNLKETQAVAEGLTAPIDCLNSSNQMQLLVIKKKPLAANCS